jgi:hypothetical protein
LAFFAFPFLIGVAKLRAFLFSTKNFLSFFRVFFFQSLSKYFEELFVFFGLQRYGFLTFPSKLFLTFFSLFLSLLSLHIIRISKNLARFFSSLQYLFFSKRVAKIRMYAFPPNYFTKRFYTTCQKARPYRVTGHKFFLPKPAL